MFCCTCSVFLALIPFDFIKSCLSYPQVVRLILWILQYQHFYLETRSRALLSFCIMLFFITCLFLFICVGSHPPACVPCSSSSRLTSCPSFRAWPCPWPRCLWVWASQPCQPSPLPPVSSHCLLCWPPRPSWPRRRRLLVTAWTATVRRTETSLTRSRLHAALLL